MPDAPPRSQIEKLTDAHDTAAFRCRKRPLERWLKRHALKNQRLDSSQTYVVHRAGRVVGYYSLTYSEVQHEACPRDIGAHMPEAFAIPVVLLARLAIDDGEEKTGLGKALLKDALSRAAAAADIAGARAVLVHALDEEAKAFYAHFGFVESPTNDLHLMMSLATIRLNQPPT